MTDKRKRAARAISEKTGMSHQAAINSLSAAKTLQDKEAEKARLKREIEISERILASTEFGPSPSRREECDEVCFVPPDLEKLRPLLEKGVPEEVAVQTVRLIKKVTREEPARTGPTLSELESDIPILSEVSVPELEPDFFVPERSESRRLQAQKMLEARDQAALQNDKLKRAVEAVSDLGRTYLATLQVQHAVGERIDPKIDAKVKVLASAVDLLAKLSGHSDGPFIPNVEHQLLQLKTLEEAQKALEALEAKRREEGLYDA